MRPLGETEIRLLLTETAREKYDIPRMVQAVRDLDELRRWLVPRRLIACGRCNGQLDTATRTAAFDALVDDPSITMPLCVDCAKGLSTPPEPTKEAMERALLDAGWDSSCAGGIPAGRSWRAPPGSPKHCDGAYRLTRDAWILLTRPS